MSAGFFSSFIYKYAGTGLSWVILIQFSKRVIFDYNFGNYCRPIFKIPLLLD